MTYFIIEIIDMIFTFPNFLTFWKSHEKHMFSSQSHIEVTQNQIISWRIFQISDESSLKCG